MRLTKSQVAQLPKLLCFRQPWRDRPVWAWQDKGVMREVARLLKLGYAAEGFTGNALVLAKKSARAKAYRVGARKAAATRKRLARSRASEPGAVENVGVKAA